MDADNYVDMVNGKLDGTKAFMKNQLKVSGNMALAQKMRKIFPVATTQHSIEANQIQGPQKINKNAIKEGSALLYSNANNFFLSVKEADGRISNHPVDAKSLSQVMSDNHISNLLIPEMLSGYSRS